MIEREKIKSCAENIVKCVKVSEDDCVYIRGGIYCQELLEEIALNVLRNGGLPHLTSSSDNYAVSIYQDEKIKTKTLEKTPKHVLKMIENIDIYIVIEPYQDPSIQNKFPREKLFASSKASAPIRDILYGSKKEYEPGKRWLYAGWPSKLAADFYKINYDLYETFIVDGMSVPVEDLMEITRNLGMRFENAKNVHIKDELGTDCWVSIEDRRINYDAGMLTDEMIAVGDLGGNLPAGEIFIAPHEKIGEGKLFCPLTIDRYSNKILKNVELYFKDGVLQIDKVSADNDIEDLKASFKQCEEIDKTKDLAEIRTYNVAELGIGCNPKITKAIGYILTDEKITGSVHIAFGSNKMYGGTSVSQMHWDFVTTPQADITVEYKNGTKKKIMESGKLLDN
ncbi:MAG: aminopeptidase [Promethearchaeota archaeon]|nr:MAG: aminopeptidase [Candidatus Lokiarchaeota archaeon]